MSFIKNSVLTNDRSGLKVLRAVSAVAIGFVFSFMLAVNSASAASNPFKKVKGSWRSAGATAIVSGNRERIRCRASYRTPGNKVGFTLKCSGPGYFINVRVNARVNGGNVQGSWSESKYAKSGGLSGSASNKHSSLGFWGGGISGNMSISLTSSRRHRIVINAAGNKVVIPLRR